MPSRSASSGSRQRRTDYSTTPLLTKLGIKAGSDVLFVDAPPGFKERLAPMPDGATVHARARGDLDVMVLFVTRAADLRRRFARLAKNLRVTGGLWVAWPKRSARAETDLTFELVQSVGLESGLVDNKSAAIDDTWQGLRFVIRRRDRRDAT